MTNAFLVLEKHHHIFHIICGKIQFKISDDQIRVTVKIEYIK